MNFETVADLTDQTFLITPRDDGQVVRFGGVDTTTTALTPVRVYGSGTVELSEGYWDQAGLFDGNYDGPWVAGDPAATVRVTIERSTDGTTWEPVPGGDLTGPATLYDFESPSHGVLEYRVTAYTAENATATTITTVTADSMAFWLSGGVGFAQTCRLPLNPDVSYTTGRERVEKWWAGRERPETITGEGVRETVSVSGTTWDLIDGQGAATASPSELRSLARSAERLHLFRTPDGNRVYGQLSSITMPRKLSMKLDGGWNGYWGYSFDITEAT